MDQTIPEALTVSDARVALPAILRRFRGDPSAPPIAVGSRRRADAVLIPYRQFDTLTATVGPGADVLRLVERARPLIHRLASMNKIAAVALFGSVARGAATESSDVDLLVDPEDDASLFDLAQFGIDMEQLLGIPVDVVSRRALDPQRDAAILADVVPV